MNETPAENGPADDSDLRKFLGYTLKIYALLCLGGLFYLWTLIAISSEGSKSLAKEWREEMAAWESPDDLQSGRSYLCANGEWALIKAQDSHGGFWNGGGTLVVKDSNGGLKTFHKGHVCGSNNLIIDEEQGSPTDLSVGSRSDRMLLSCAYKSE